MQEVYTVIIMFMLLKPKHIMRKLLALIILIKGIHCTFFCYNNKYLIEPIPSPSETVNVGKLFDCARLCHQKNCKFVQFTGEIHFFAILIPNITTVLSYGWCQHNIERRPVHRNVATWQTSEIVGIKQESKGSFWTLLCIFFHLIEFLR